MKYYISVAAKQLGAAAANTAGGRCASLYYKYTENSLKVPWSNK